MHLKTWFPKTSQCHLINKVLSFFAQTKKHSHEKNMEMNSIRKPPGSIFIHGSVVEIFMNPLFCWSAHLNLWDGYFHPKKTMDHKKETQTEQTYLTGNIGAFQIHWLWLRKQVLMGIDLMLKQKSLDTFTGKLLRGGSAWQNAVETLQEKQAWKWNDISPPGN